MVNVLNRLQIFQGVMNIVFQKRVGSEKKVEEGWRAKRQKGKNGPVEPANSNKGLKEKPSNAHKFRMCRNEKRPSRFLIG